MATEPLEEAMWMQMQRMAAAVMMITALAACGPSEPSASAPGRGRSNMITEEQIQASPTTNLFDAVSRIRPSWLAAKVHGGNRGYPTVFVGPQRYGEIDYLRTVENANVREVHYFDPISAAARFGRNVPFGVIQVILDIGG
jgi:hypothetical protein